MNMKPIKTEYKGIVFDSKSEAVFARVLDLVGMFSWGYHPYHQSKCTGHDWDFSLCWTKNKIFHDVDDFQNLLIEYKPKSPTRTYLSNLVDKMKKTPHDSAIVWGNPWDGVPKGNISLDECSYVLYPIILQGYNACDEPDDPRLFSYRHTTYEYLGIRESHVQEAKQYRFDLQQ